MVFNAIFYLTVIIKYLKLHMYTNIGHRCSTLRSTMFQLYRGVIIDGGGHWATDLSQVNVSSISFQIAFATLVLTTKVDVGR
jgi:hypothetical protein